MKRFNVVTSRSRAMILALAVLIMVACQSKQPDAADTAPPPGSGPVSGPKIEVTDKSFKCIRDMKPVRGFYVDNIAGNLDGTLAIANSETGGIYPPGSVVQLFPNEVMVKREHGFNPVTKDWEFFELDVDEKGSTIRKRGFQDVKNRFGGNCFSCHVGAKPEWDMICESGHGCAPLPIADVAIKSLQNTDPRCQQAADIPFTQKMTAWFIKTFTSF
ncbi:MAG TPA: hypothetical protein VFM46_01770 [Pseudomonadales bacterium]|nr:hypothetical protein [Pseudomonadales bacterium]